MTWVKLDDRFPDDPKVELLSAVAFRLYVSGLCHSSRHETDGRIPMIRAKRLLPAGSPVKATQELIQAGLWVIDGDQYAIPNYLKYNPSHDTLERKRADDRRRKVRDSAPDSLPDSTTESDRTPRGRLRPSRPVPEDASPDSVLSKPIVRDAARAADDQEEVRRYMLESGFQDDQPNAMKLTGSGWTTKAICRAIDMAKPYHPVRVLTYIQISQAGRPNLLSRAKQAVEEEAHAEVRAGENAPRTGAAVRA